MTQVKGLPPLNWEDALLGKLPNKHNDFGPFGELKILGDLLKRIGPLPELKDWKAGMERAQSGAGPTGFKPAMGAWLFHLAQAYNRAVMLDRDSVRWDEHEALMKAIRDKTWHLLDALDPNKLELWQETLLASRANLDQGLTGNGANLNDFRKRLENLEQISDLCTRAEMGGGRPYRDFHGRADLRLAYDLLGIWKEAQKKDGNTDAFRRFAEDFMTFAKGDKATSLQSPIKEAVAIFKNHPEQRPISLFEPDSPHMVNDWTFSHRNRSKE